VWMTVSRQAKFVPWRRILLVTARRDGGWTNNTLGVYMQ
jgi:hypothetical protein